CQKYDTSPWTF
nr:immunoglobulin light chain junction region [Macaca mulatta]MOX57188.1 immunoglobulin light chain junction region [Macaca mulatta]